MLNQHDNTQKRLDILYDDQRSLLERLQIHQRNLNRLLSQKANHGLDVPLRVYNEIDQQELEINVVKKLLNEVDSGINGILGQSKPSPTTSNEPIQPSVSVNGVDYLIEAPYPFLRIEIDTSSKGVIFSKWIYVGGIEVHVINQSPDSLHLNFFMHGQRVSPVIDHQNKKFIVPLNYGIIVSSLILNTQSILTEDDALPEIIANGTWTVVSPGFPIGSVSVNDWPRGSNDLFHTTHVTYERGYDLWLVQSVEESKVTVWFYEQGWNVAPIINEANFTLAFPKQSQHPISGGETTMR